MNVEELERMCDSVIETSNQLDQDYSNLVIERTNKINSLCEDLQCKINYLKDNYSNIIKKLFTKICDSNVTSYSGFNSGKLGTCSRYFMCNDVAFTISGHYNHYLFGCFLSNDGDIIFAEFDDYVFNHEYSVYENIYNAAWSIGTKYCTKYHETFYSIKDFLDFIKNGNRACVSDEEIVSNLTLILNNAERMVQETIAKYSKKLLEINVSRNQNVIDTINKE